MTAVLDRALSLAADRLDGTSVDELAERRRELLAECPTPAHLAARFDATFIRTEAVDLVAQRLRDTVNTADGRLVISVPPQEMKTTSIRWLVFWLLLEDPDRRIVLASYAVGLARTSGRIIRSIVETHGAPYGLELDRSHADAADWQIAGHRGGLLSVGVGGSLTGRPSDVMVVDDPLRNQQDADSPTIRGRLHEWWEAVARTRLAPGAPVLVVQTRWHPDDLAGRMVDRHGWPVLNIPALADGQTDDALGRPAGTWLVSTRGRTAADWQGIRDDVGERVWASLYQGRPAPLEGGVFKTQWFDTWRVAEPPPDCLPPTVVVDPADNEGSGDEAGIIVATVHPPSGRVFILDDLSAAMTVARWARLACLTCVRRDAPTLAYEQSLSQLPARIRDAWRELHAQANALVTRGGDEAGAVTMLVRPVDGAEVRDRAAAALAELDLDTARKVLAVGSSGPRLHRITAKGTKEARMQWVAPMFETGRVVLAGRFPALEHQAVTWQPGQDSPDRVDAAVHACSLATTPTESTSRPRARAYSAASSW